MRLARSPPHSGRTRATRSKTVSSPNLTDVNTDTPNMPQKRGGERGAADVGEKGLYATGIFGSSEELREFAKEAKEVKEGKGKLPQDIGPPGPITGEKDAMGRKFRENLGVKDAKAAEFQNPEHEDGGKSMAPDNSETGNVSIMVEAADAISNSLDDSRGEISELVPEVRRLDSDAYKPWGSRSASTSPDPGITRQSEMDKDRTTCKGGPGKLTCGILVKDGDQGVECDKCLNWFHLKCQSVSKTAYSAVQKWHGTLLWLCDKCKKSLKDAPAPCRCPKLEDGLSKLEAVAHGNAQTLDEIQSSMKKDTAKLRENMEERMERVEHVMRAHADLIGNQERILEAAFKKIQDEKKSYAETVKGSCDVMQEVAKKIETIPLQEKGQGGRQTEKAIAGVFDDFLDKEKRKLNIVVHNIPEPQGETYAQRVDHDKSTFKEVIREGMRLNVNVTKAFRVGKVGLERPRLLVVGLENAEVKMEVLKMAPQLRSTDRYSNVYITPDLTWKEREEGRKLREELKRRTNAGEDLTIRRGRIVKRARNEHHPESATSEPRQSRDSMHQPSSSAQPSRTQQTSQEQQRASPAPSANQTHN